METQARWTGNSRWLTAMAISSVLFALTLSIAAHSQTSVLSVPPDSARWDLQGQAKITEYQGRKSLLLDGGAAVLKDSEMRDGVIDVDVATSAKRGFFGFDFRIDKPGSNYEEVYLRQHKSGLPDAMQYTPVLNTDATGNSTMGLGLPVRWISRKTLGSTCAWR